MLLSAAVGGFHDTVWLLVLLSLIDSGASWLLHATTQESAKMADEEEQKEM